MAKAFARSCTLNAEASADGKLSHRQASDACANILTCLEERMTVTELAKTERDMQAGRANPGARILRGCEKQAIKQIVG